MAYRVLIADGSRIARMLFARLVTESRRYALAGALDSPAKAAEFCAGGGVDLALMDVVTPGGVDLAAAGELKRKSPGVRLILTCSAADGRLLRAGRELGAESLWYKDHSPLPLTEVMDRTMAGQSVYPDAPPALSLGVPPGAELTRRELDVLRELAAGAGNRAVGARLGMGEETVKVHVKHLLAKTGCANRVELAVRAVLLGLAVPEARAPER